MRPFLSCLLLSITCCCPLSARAEEAAKQEKPAAASAQKATDKDLTTLHTWMAGAFSSKVQSEQDPAYFHVTLRMATIFPELKGEHWLYVEQAMESAPDKPYRQRVYQLALDTNGGIVSRVYNLPGDPLSFAGEWKKDKPLATLQPKDLQEKVGCAIHLKKVSEDKYEGSTKEKECASELNGASYATSKVTITAAALHSWDQGFDSADKQVWGAKAGPYQFLKEDKK
jgi:hypothetical protein